MTRAQHSPDSGMRPLTAAECAVASGGMKWDHNYQSADVIDARGGSLTVLGMTFTFDVKGKLSSIS